MLANTLDAKNLSTDIVAAYRYAGEIEDLLERSAVARDYNKGVDELNTAEAASRARAQDAWKKIGGTQQTPGLLAKIYSDPAAARRALASGKFSVQDLQKNLDALGGLQVGRLTHKDQVVQVFRCGDALEGVDIHLDQINALTRQRMDRNALGVWS